MVNGFFLGGFQEGMSERRQFDHKKKMDESADRRADEELGLSRRRVGLAAAELGLSERRLELEKTKEANDQAYRQGTLSLQDRAIRVQENAENYKREQDLATRADQTIKDIMATIKETVVAARETGHTPEQAAAAVKPLLDKVVSLSDKTGLKSDHYVNQVNSMIAAPTSTELAIAQGAAKGAGALAQAETLVSGGVGRQSALETAGVKGPPKEIDLRTFSMPDGTVKSVRADDAAGIDAALAAGGVSTPMSVRASDVGGLAVATPDKKAIADASKSIRDTQTNLEELQKTLDDFKKTPEAAGIPGEIIEKVGGIVEQLPWGIGDEALNAAGVDIKAVTKARTQARAAIGQTLRLVSQDNSRFSDADRKLAEQTLQVLTPTAGDDTVRSAFDTVINIMKRQQLKDIDEIRVAAKISIKDLETDEGVNKLGDLLTNKGMTADQAIEAIYNIKQRHGLR